MTRTNSGVVGRVAQLEREVVELRALVAALTMSERIASLAARVAAVEAGAQSAAGGRK